MQPAPNPLATGAPIWELVIADMRLRDVQGTKSYLRQALEERRYKEGK
jgi:hypothetical protein